MAEQSPFTDLMQAYGRHFDARDAAAFAGLFSPSATIVALGGKEITGVDRIRGLVERTPPGGQHRVGPTELLERSEELAASRTPFSATTADGATLAGTYEDEFVRTPDGWRIARHVMTVDR